MANANDRIMESIRDYIEVPSHVVRIANVIRYDLMYGPFFAFLPDEIENFNSENYLTYSEGEKDFKGEAGRVVEVITLHSILEEYLDSVPTLYADEDGFVTTASYNVVIVEDEHDDGTIEEAEHTFENDEIDSKVVKEALFGKIIADNL